MAIKSIISTWESAIAKSPWLVWVPRLIILGFLLVILLNIFLKKKSGKPEPRPSFETQVRELEIESLRGVEYFNSSIFDSSFAITAANANKLVTKIKETNRQYLLPLLALRQLNQAIYDTINTRKKTGILIDALNEAVYFNGWGMPAFFRQSPREVAIDAIIDLGLPALPFLRRLLFERRSAPFWGLETETPEQRYQVRDYAVALIVEIEIQRAIESSTFADSTFVDSSFVFPISRGARDTLIQRYLERNDERFFN